MSTRQLSKKQPFQIKIPIIVNFAFFFAKVCRNFDVSYQPEKSVDLFCLIFENFHFFLLDGKNQRSFLAYFSKIFIFSYQTEKIKDIFCLFFEKLKTFVLSNFGKKCFLIRRKNISNVFYYGRFFRDFSGVFTHEILLCFRFRIKDGGV